MGQKEKLLRRLESRPSDFTFKELVTLLGHYNYTLSNDGPGGSAVIFTSDEHEAIRLHKPHPRNELKMYQVRQVLDQLKKEGIL